MKAAWPHRATIGAAMPHVHAHAPHELTEPHEHAAGTPDRAEKRMELLAVLLLSLATVATAWSGYQAARWSGEQSQDYARASTLRIKAQQQATEAGQLRIDDLNLFDGWLDARESGNMKLARIYRRRFRPDFVPAFDAWMAQKPLTTTAAIAGPQYLPQYRLPEAAVATKLDAQADDLYRKGTDAKTNDDRFIYSTVFLAAVLFFSGISMRIDWRPLRLVVLGMAAVMLVGTVSYLATLPLA
jgi:hypothetical protein